MTNLTKLKLQYFCKAVTRMRNSKNFLCFILNLFDKNSFQKDIKIKNYFIL